MLAIKDQQGQKNTCKYRNEEAAECYYEHQHFLVLWVHLLQSSLQDDWKGPVTHGEHPDTHIVRKHIDNGPGCVAWTQVKRLVITIELVTGNASLTFADILGLVPAAYWPCDTWDR